MQVRLCVLSNKNNHNKLIIEFTNKFLMNKMPSAKDKKMKNKLLKIEVSSSSGSDESEHELSYYVKDKVKLMKEVLKLIKPKKIKSMAPDCIKNLDIVEINSMLLEELLGISNKRLQYIFNGENVDRETSSSESEEEKQPIDVISLDDISDDDDIEFCISEQEKSSLEEARKGPKHKAPKIKTENIDSTIKTEKCKKKSKKSNDLKNQLDGLKENDKDKLMSVLELLELQARARAIRSQLAIENEKKKPESEQSTSIKVEEGSDSDAIIIESPKHKEIVITSSDSEEEILKNVLQNETNSLDNIQQSNVDVAPPPPKKQKSDSSQKQDVIECIIENEDITQSNETKKVDDSNKQTETTDSDNYKKKQKLLAKIQKIKLVRNRSKNSNIKDISNNSKCSDNAIVKSAEIDIHSTVINVNSDEKELSENTKCSEIKCKDESSLFESDKNDDEKANHKARTKKESKNTNYCDNDEIVINLDEDEMDGIEND